MSISKVLIGGQAVGSVVVRRYQKSLCGALVSKVLLMLRLVACSVVFTAVLMGDTWQLHHLIIRSRYGMLTTVSPWRKLYLGMNGGCGTVFFL
uniref:Uncharacterized protein n=1 Tax=Chenopodium quinoa TaxID=63459 RepID=A0A803MA73_CHEQI